MAVVLIADDDEPLRVLAQSILEDAGHAALTAANPKEALALLEADTELDLLFTDLEMDGDPLAGVELAKSVHEKRPETPVIYTSGAGVTDGTRALFVAFSDFLPKPYTAHQLTEAVEKSLARN
jgi:DNA-binding NtrC family response regulator